MKVALTGATGFVGSHVLTDLSKHGHEVTALVRNDDQADIVAARGATPTVVDLYDRLAVGRILGDADGAGQFIERTALNAPSALASGSDGHERYRWAVRDTFAASAYDQFR